MTPSLKPSHHNLRRLAAGAACALLLSSCDAAIDEPQAQLPPQGQIDREVVTFATSGTAGATASRHTDDGFEEGDILYIHACKPGELPSGMPKQYKLKNGVFEPMFNSSIITKEPGETLEYIAQNVSRAATPWLYPAGNSSYYDALICITESASTTVALDFIHLMSQLNVHIKGLSSSREILGVNLLDIHVEFEIRLEDDEMSVYGPTRKSVSMGKVDQANYRYFAPPMHFIQAYTDFIEVILNTGEFYKFYLSNDVMLDNNHAYFWEIDLSTASPSAAPAAAPLGQAPAAAPARLVESRPLSPGRPVILNNQRINHL